MQFCNNDAHRIYVQLALKLCVIRQAKSKASTASFIIRHFIFSASNYSGVLGIVIEEVVLRIYNHHAIP